MVEDKKPDNDKPLKAAENPLAAALLGAILVKHGRLNNDQQMQDAGADLVRIAEQSAPQGVRLPQRGKPTQD